MWENKPLTDERITVLGGGVSGISLACLAAKLGADVFLSDAGALSADAEKKLAEHGVVFEAEGHSSRVFECDRVLVGSGFPARAQILSAVQMRDLPVVGELDFVSPWLHGDLIGITGSNGKTTTTSMLGHLLRCLGHDVAVVGNIGSPLADIAGERHDFIVAEFSSFQLYRAHSLPLAGAIVTNLAPDHIDWHGSYDNYVEAKARIIDLLRPNGFAVVQKRDANVLHTAPQSTYTLSWTEGENSREIVLDAATEIARMDDTVLFSFHDTSLIGTHNMENVAMALGCVRLLGCNADAARKGLSTYVPPPHRCALVAVVNGVRYVNDSKGTNVAAAITALSSIAGKKVIILGGRGKGEDYRALIPVLRENARRAILIGEAAGEIAGTFHAGGYCDYELAEDMESAVLRASTLAQSGDVVLLSPACTSWDAYRNYGERGDHFAALAKALETESK